MSTPLISVIVPVYNAEQYLQKCVDSIRGQTYKNLEIILIDDTSPDNCGAMCDAYAAEDPRIRVVHKENGGQSSARNRGLDIMQGDLVGFVDSDDWIEPDMYQTLYDLKVQTGAQIAACGIQLDDKQGFLRYFNPDYPADKSQTTYTMLEALREIISNKKITYSLADKLFDREIFSDLRMTVGQIFEDEEMLPKCIERADKVAYTPVPYYHYLITNNSTTHGAYTARHFREVEIAWNKVTDYAVRYPMLYKDAYAGYIDTCIAFVQLSKGSEECAVLRKDLARQLKEEPLSEEITAKLSRSRRIKLTALRLGLWAFDGLMAVYHCLDALRNRRR